MLIVFISFIVTNSYCKRYEDIIIEQDVPTLSSPVVDVLIFLEGDLGNITCSTIPDTPTQLIDWYFNDFQISQGQSVISTKYHVHRSGFDTHTLFIYPLDKNDTGKYTCVDHDNGEISEFQVYIKKDWCIERSNVNILQFNFVTLLITVIMVQ
ncbi:hypothetical protein GJ496_004765 [Pomphorhynchus laevis]|nr:hypothetical protein GJ496_004765 [Pomphorhynchus laevis]